MRISLRTVLIALVALVAIGAVWNSLSGASAPTDYSSSHSNGACSDEGVTLVTSYNGDQKAVCAHDFNGTGWDLFEATGTEARGTDQYPVGFVCTVAGQPANQDCKDTPRYDEGTWAYFFAKPGDTEWRFAGFGASMNRPGCGEAQAWVFADSKTDPATAKPSGTPPTFSCK